MSEHRELSKLGVTDPIPFRNHDGDHFQVDSGAKKNPDFEWVFDEPLDSKSRFSWSRLVGSPKKVFFAEKKCILTSDFQGFTLLPIVMENE